VFNLGTQHTKPQIDWCIKQLSREGHYISNIRGDGEFRYDPRIYSSSSPFDNHNRAVDRVIRTIRDAVGMNYHDMREPDRVQSAVQYYNITPHRALYLNRLFTPQEVENDKDLEGLFIRKNKEKLEKIKTHQGLNGLFNYKPGNVLLVHLDFSRTAYKFMKKRRIFNALAIFLR
jgi:hypothetical protein